MQFGLSEEQVLLQDNVNRFLDDHASLNAVRDYAAGGEDAALWQGLTELGVSGLLISEGRWRRRNERTRRPPLLPRLWAITPRRGHF